MRKPHVERMIAEYKDLKERHGKLWTFIDKGCPESLYGEEWELLEKQSVIMADFLEVLHSRLIIELRKEFLD